MPARRQVALAAALLGIAAVASSIPSTLSVQSAAVVTTTTDPPSTEVLDLPTETMPPTTTTITPPTTSTTATTRPSSGPPPVPVVEVSGDQFDALASCETGGTMDPATNTGNGYYGAFQFDLQTWESTGRSGLPSNHSYAEQKKAAMELHAVRGWHPWPRCARKLGYL